MKYISVVVLLSLMVWTWCLATSPRGFNLEEHKLVEASVEQDIRYFIQRKYPDIQDIYCLQLFTETVSAGSELNVRFRCQAVGPSGPDDTAEQIFEGFIHLKSEDHFESWTVIDGEIRSPSVRFLNGVKITPETQSEGAQ